MKQIVLIITSLFLSKNVATESIYSFSITTIEGNSVQLSAYQGKKMLIVTLPAVQNASNDSLLYSLDSLRNTQNGSLVIIGAPSYEDGYSPSNKTSLIQWYRSFLNPSVVIADGLYSRKISGNLQHPLFRWLTDKDKNGHFERDVDGPRSKFIIWADGELIGSLGTQTRVGGSTINNLLQ